MEEPQFKYEKSPDEGISKLAQTVVHLSELSERLANEKRTLVNHADQRPENVAEHSVMLAIITPIIIEEFFPHLDANKATRYATIHDILEAYVGDTPTHNIDQAGTLKKQAREQAGLAKLKQDFAHLPSFVRSVEAYEAQIEPEARFVRVLDKSMPMLMHLANGGVVLKQNQTLEEINENSALRSAELERDYPEFAALIRLREELVNLMSNKFLR